MKETISRKSSYINILTRLLMYRAEREVAPASCWPRPSEGRTRACAGVASAVPATPRLASGRQGCPPLPRRNLAALAGGYAASIASCDCGVRITGTPIYLRVFVHLRPGCLHAGVPVLELFGCPQVVRFRGRSLQTACPPEVSQPDR